MLHIHIYNIKKGIKEELVTNKYDLEYEKDVLTASFKILSLFNTINLSLFYKLLIWLKVNINIFNFSKITYFS